MDRTEVYGTAAQEDLKGLDRLGGSIKPTIYKPW
jgi:hypothetical protein